MPRLAALTSTSLSAAGISVSSIGAVDEPNTQTKVFDTDAMTGGTLEFFGYAVAISGNGLYAVTGATQADGGAGDPTADAGQGYVYHRTAVGEAWTLQATLVPSDAELVGRFGRDVAINTDGTYIIVGASNQDTDGEGGEVDSGAAYVFTRTGTNWTEQQKLVASDAQEDDGFGLAIDINEDANIAVIASPNEYGGAGDPKVLAGCVYVFTRSGSTWTEAARIQPSGLVAVDLFGNGVAISKDGNYIAIGAYGDDTETSGAGAVYIYTGSGSSWTEQAKLTASDAASSAKFGWDVDLNGDGTYLAVGAQGDSSNRGKAYVFTRSASTWTEQDILTASDVAPSDYYGYSVAIDENGETLVVGTQRSEAVYVYDRSGSTWSESNIIVADDAGLNDYFGEDVDINDAGTFVIAGARLEDHTSTNGNANYGSVYLFPTTYTTSGGGGGGTPTYTLSGPASVNEGSGFQIALTTTNVSQGTTVPYTITGVTSADIDSASLTGNFTMGTNYATVNFTTSADATTEGAETFTLSLDNGEDSINVTINDTSLTPAATPDWAALADRDELTHSTRSTGDRMGTAVAISGDGNYAVSGGPQNPNTTGVGGEVAVWKNTSGTWSQDTMLTPFQSPISGPSSAGRRIHIEDADGSSSYLIYGIDANGNVGNIFGPTGTADPSLTFDVNDIIEFRFDQTLSSHPFFIQTSGGTNVTLLSGSQGATSGSLVWQPTSTGSYRYICGSHANMTGTITVQTGSRPALNTQNGFGTNVAMDELGLRIAVGAPNADSDGAFNGPGAVYIYTRTGSSWGSEIKITNPGPAATSLSLMQYQDGFGTSVDMTPDGQYLVVGAPFNDTTGTDNSGKVYLFQRTGTDWSLSATLTSSDRDRYGTDVTISDNGLRIATACIDAADSGNSCVDVWHYGDDETETWARVKSWEETDEYYGSGTTSSTSGTKVAFSGDGQTLVIGDPGWNTGTGAVHITEYIEGTWTARNGATFAGYYFIYAGTPRLALGTDVNVNTDGSIITVGIPGYPGTGVSNGKLEQGGFIQLVRSGGNYYFTGDTTAQYNPNASNLTVHQTAGPGDDEHVGKSVAISDDGFYVIAGGDEYPDSSGPDTGGRTLIAKASNA